MGIPCHRNCGAFRVVGYKFQAIDDELSDRITLMSSLKKTPYGSSLSALFYIYSCIEMAKVMISTTIKTAVKTEVKTAENFY